MDFTILGPLEVRDDTGAPLALGKRRQRMLLAVLLLRANDIVPVDTIVEALWPTAAPARPLASVHAYVAGLRRALEAQPRGGAPTRLLTRRPGYLLRVEPGELDLDRFAEAVAAGRAASDPVQARELFHRALGEWRGQALADFAFEPFAERRVEQLGQLRIDAIEARIQADLDCGFADVIADCESLIAEHPLRERLWQLLAVALYRAGRQHDAVECCQELRRTLAESGLEPAPSLRELESALLRQDPALDGAPTAEGEALGLAQPPAPHWLGDKPGVFVGRARELDELEALWKATVAGRSELALLLGEPGIGKTTTAARFLASIEDGLTLAGRCTAGAPIPFEPFVEILDALVALLSDEELAKLGPHRRQLGRMLPLSRGRLGTPGPRAVPASEVGRYQLFAAVTALLELVAGERPVALLLDDVQLADDSTLTLLRHLLGQRIAGGLLAVATVRTTDVEDAARMEAVLTALRAGRGVRVAELPLGGFSASEVDGYLDERLGAADPRRAAQLRALTGGNPLFLAELVAAEQAAPGAGGGEAVPDGLRSLILGRLGTLPAPVCGVLELAAVAGERLDVGLLASVSGAQPSALATEIDRAVQAGLVEETELGLQFRHDVVREVLVDRLSPARRALLHRELGEAILARHRAHLEPHLGRLAGHFAQAAVDGDSARAVEFAARAGWSALGHSAYLSAIERFQTGLQVQDRAGDAPDDVTVELAAGLAEAYRRAGLVVEARRVAFERLPGALRASAPPRLLAMLGVASVQATWDAAEVAASAELLERCLAKLNQAGDEASSEAARVAAVLAGVRSEQGDDHAARGLWRQALDTVLDRGEAVTLVPVLRGCLIGLANELPLRERGDLARRMLAAAAPTGDPELIADSHTMARTLALERGDRDEARRHAYAYEALVEELGMPRYLAGRAQRRAMVALLEGRFAAAEAFVADTEQHQPDPEFAEGVAAQLFMLHVERGRAGDLAELIGGAAAPAGSAVWRAAGALMFAECGDDAAAAERLGDLVSAVVAADHDWLWLVAATLTAWSSSLVGAAAPAEQLFGSLSAERGRHVVVNDGLLYLGAVDHHVGTLAFVRGEMPVAVEALSEAVEAHHRLGAGPFEVRSRLWLARALSARAASGDPGRAAEHRERGLALAEALGLADRVVREARAAPMTDR